MMATRAPKRTRSSWLRIRKRDGLDALHRGDLNLCIWARRPSSRLAEYINAEIIGRPIKRVVECSLARPAFNELLQDLPMNSARQRFEQDLHKQLTLLGGLMPIQRVELKLETVTGNLCQRFHVDRVPLRLICTYAGAGTQWLDNRHADRAKLGPGAGGLADEESGLLLRRACIKSMRPFEVGLMKGAGWPGNESAGLIHRSPRAEAGKPRVLFKIDVLR